MFEFLDPIHDIEDNRNNNNVSKLIEKKFIMTRLSLVFLHYIVRQSFTLGYIYKAKSCDTYGH